MPVSKKKYILTVFPQVRTFSSTIVAEVDMAESEFERRVTELERKCLEDPDLDIEVMYYELFHPHYA